MVWSRDREVARTAFRVGQRLINGCAGSHANGVAVAMNRSSILLSELQISLRIFVARKLHISSVRDGRALQVIAEKKARHGEVADLDNENVINYTKLNLLGG
jgi:hypothetical protein